MVISFMKNTITGAEMIRSAVIMMSLKVSIAHVPGNTTLKKPISVAGLLAFHRFCQKCRYDPSFFREFK